MPSNIKTKRVVTGLTSVVAVVISLFFPTLAIRSQDSSRQIVLEEFTRARPPAKGSNATLSNRKVTTTSGATNSNARLREPRYRRATKALAMSTKLPRLPANEIGITIWRLRPSRSEDEAGARLLVMENDSQTQWTPERIEADTALKVGDRVRISIEAPRAGYLYVVDREQYTDGSLGDAYLIFPTKRTRGGDNRAKPGRLVDIPAQEDNPNHFTLVPSPARSDQVGEVLTIVLAPQPLPFDITEKPQLIPNNDILEWERLWGAAFERFELEDGAGLAWTKEEREAGAARGNRQLTQGEPSPQTIYRLLPSNQTSLLITVRLNYRNR
jgi:hypothetical protein